MTENPKFHLNGTPSYLPNSTPLMLAKRAKEICPKHFKFWAKVYYDVPIITNIIQDLKEKGVHVIRL